MVGIKSRLYVCVKIFTALNAYRLDFCFTGLRIGVAVDVHSNICSLLLPMFYEWTDCKKGKNGVTNIGPNDEFQWFFHTSPFFCAGSLLLSNGFKEHLESFWS